jgi:hypothetical protein
MPYYEMAASDAVDYSPLSEFDHDLEKCIEEEEAVGEKAGIGRAIHNNQPAATTAPELPKLDPTAWLSMFLFPALHSSAAHL